MSNDNQEKPTSPESTTAGTPQNETFDPDQMRRLAEKMIGDGTMPPLEKFLASMERIRAEHAPKILRAREKDQRENSSETSRSTLNSSRRPEELKE